MKKTWITSVFLLAFFITALPVLAQAQHEKQPESKTLHQAVDGFLKSVPGNNGFAVEVQQAKESLKKNQDIIILDVREAAVFKEKPVAGAVNIPLNELHDRFSELAKNKNIYVISDVDTNAAYTVFALRTHDYDGWLVKGGVDAWLKYDNSAHAKACCPPSAHHK
ncbi:MAG: hypothetical protein H6Q72_2006 [Firmicutes bacterium]|nr:hypothetical protein [Bacillota bacterium]